MDWVLLSTHCDNWYVLPSTTSGSPSLIQVTLVAGESVEVQVRVDNGSPGVNTKLVILGGAGEKMNSLNSIWL